MKQFPDNIHLCENSSPMKSTETIGSMAITTLLDGTVIKSKSVVIATGGLSLDPVLAGILIPVWGYLVAMTPQEKGESTKSLLPGPNSSNILTWNFSHDYAMVNNVLRMSGEDHFSALKPPRELEHFENLANFTSLNYAYKKVIASVSAIYSETPDYSPIIGSANPDSRVFYILGCNGWGQATLSYCASLMPALLGYTKLTETQTEHFKILNIRRFCLLPEVCKESEVNMGNSEVYKKGTVLFENISLSRKESLSRLASCSGVYQKNPRRSNVFVLPPDQIVINNLRNNSNRPKTYVSTSLDYLPQEYTEENIHVTLKDKHLGVDSSASAPQIGTKYLTCRSYN
jgi:hypothetical protein